MVEFILAFICMSVGNCAGLDSRSVGQSPMGRLTYPDVIQLTEPRVDPGADYLLTYPVSNEAFQMSSIIIRSELALYPSSLFAFAQIRKVIDCGGIWCKVGGEWYGLGGIALCRSHILLLNSVAHDSHQLLDVIHHELFHFVDNSMGTKDYDVEWQSFNEPSFKYTKIRALTSYEPKRSGFVSYYATSDACEDKAETFSWMLCHPEIVEQLVTNDQTIARKVNCLKKRLLSICPEINEEFWTRITKRRTEQLRVELEQRQKQHDERLRSEKENPPKQYVRIEEYLQQQYSPAVEKPVLHTPLESLSGSVKLFLLLLALLTPVSLVIAFRGSRVVASP